MWDKYKVIFLIVGVSIVLGGAVYFDISRQEHKPSNIKSSKRIIDNKPTTKNYPSTANSNHINNGSNFLDKKKEDNSASRLEINDTYDFRKARWGMTKEDVRLNESTTISKEIKEDGLDSGVIYGDVLFFADNAYGGKATKTATQTI